MSVMPMYNAKWKDGMIDAYKEQISQLSQAMYQLQVQNQQHAVKAEAEKNTHMSSQAFSLNEAMEGQRRMIDMYWELSKVSCLRELSTQTDCVDFVNWWSVNANALLAMPTLSENFSPCCI